MFMEERERFCFNEPMRVRIVKLSCVAVLSLLVIAGCASTGKSGPSTGWIMMVPPPTPAVAAGTDESLSQWKTEGDFASKTDCNKEMTKEQEGELGRFGRISFAQNAGRITIAQYVRQTGSVKILNGQCIAADDSPLKTQGLLLAH